MSLLIRGGEVINANGTSRRADVLMSNENIAGVGDFSSYKAEKTIDASGCFVVSGFILPITSDKHLTLFSEPMQKDLLLAGVTTAIIGHSGVSLSPTNYGELTEIKYWNAGERTNIDWKSTEDFLASLLIAGMSVNIATVSGYTTIRNSITHEYRELTEKEIDVARHMFYKSEREGSFGLSLLTDEFSIKEFPYLFDLLKEGSLWVSSYLSDNGDALLEIVKNKSLQKIIFRDSFLMGKKNAGKLIKEIKEIKQSPCYFSVNPFQKEEIIFADIFGSQIFKYNTLEFMEKMDGKRMQNIISKFLSNISPDSIFIANAPTQYKFLLGKSLREFADNRLITPEEGIIRLFDISKGRMSFFAEIRDRETKYNLIRQNNSFIEGNWSPMAGISKVHKDLSNPIHEFMKIAKEIGISIEDMFNKLSYIPAKALGLERRGEIKTGNIADIVIVKNDQVRDSIIRGEQVVSSGVAIGERRGKILKNV